MISLGPEIYVLCYREPYLSLKPKPVCAIESKKIAIDPNQPIPSNVDIAGLQELGQIICLA